MALAASSGDAAASLFIVDEVVLRAAIPEDDADGAKAFTLQNRLEERRTVLIMHIRSSVDVLGHLEENDVIVVFGL